MSLYSFVLSANTVIWRVKARKSPGCPGEVGGRSLVRSASSGALVTLAAALVALTVLLGFVTLALRGTILALNSFKNKGDIKVMSVCIYGYRKGLIFGEDSVS